MCGSATLTTVVSRTSISWATSTIAMPWPPAWRPAAGRRLRTVRGRAREVEVRDDMGLSCSGRRADVIGTERASVVDDDTETVSVSQGVRCRACRCARNHDRILEVAREVFAERATPSMDESPAGGGRPRTLYRHFPSRDTSRRDHEGLARPDRRGGRQGPCQRGLAPRAAVAWFRPTSPYLPAPRRPGQDHQRHGRRRSPIHQVPGPHRGQRAGPGPARQEGALRDGIERRAGRRLVGGIATVADRAVSATTPYARCSRSSPTAC